eukprot:CAMPEP_0194151902 /NCGR_PEP_ID=MMETSP0152-20130528/49959_1 /TAXON_ID=1049557 /ORGANISM="Thalassiothrix antarctica, Strain L6-D1" /LENGTH=152 /DNA_ID=CAMNT_0038856023 /DNA_START=13 /DNA_END=467 /DNA_ORIENTATION=+
MAIHADEVSMVEGALGMKTKTADDILTPLKDVFAVPSDTILDEEKIIDIYSSGYSRVPIFEKRTDDSSIRSIVGILLTKQLMVVEPEYERKITTLPLQIPFTVSPQISLIELVNLFQAPSLGKKRSHMALVCNFPQKAEQLLDRGVAITDDV